MTKRKFSYGSSSQNRDSQSTIERHLDEHVMTARRQRTGQRTPLAQLDNHNQDADLNNIVLHMFPGEEEAQHPQQEPHLEPPAGTEPEAAQPDAHGAANQQAPAEANPTAQPEAPNPVNLHGQALFQAQHQQTQPAPHTANT